MIPGFIISILTFPGVIVHEWAHLMMCRLVGVRVHEVCYFRFGNPAGYVVHEAPRNPWANILIGYGPLIINTIVGAIIGGLFWGKETPNGDNIFTFIMIYLGVSIAMHSFPSTGDAKSMWSAIWAKGSPFLLKIVGTPLVAIIFIGALGSIFWLDLVYGVFVVIGASEFASTMHLKW
ncbi:MAG: metalloprotease family protein [bacterium]